MESNYTDEELLALSGIQHYAFCERQWGLIHLEQQWQENLKTAEGHILHERVHDTAYKESRVGVVSARSLPLKSYSLGLAGVADLVEFVLLSDENDKCGVLLPGRKGRYQPVPVEYKRGKPKKDDRDAVQLCAQAICLEEMMSVQSKCGYLFYGQTQRRVEVVFDHKLRQRVESLAKSMHHSYEAGYTPIACKAVKCSLCSMENICLPKVIKKTKSVEVYLSEMRAEADLKIEV